MRVCVCEREREREGDGERERDDDDDDDDDGDDVCLEFLLLVKNLASHGQAFASSVSASL